jgi:hypothetical protein
MGDPEGIVEADETYHGKREVPHTPSVHRKGRPYTKGGKTGGFDKWIIVPLVERHGSVRSFHVGAVDKTVIRDILTRHVAKESRLHTDESRLYAAIGADFASHETVNHRTGEYVGMMST